MKVRVPESQKPEFEFSVGKFEVLLVSAGTVKLTWVRQRAEASHRVLGGKFTV